MNQHSIEYVERYYKQFLVAKPVDITPSLAFLIICGSLAFGALMGCCVGIAA